MEKYFYSFFWVGASGTSATSYSSGRPFELHASINGASNQPTSTSPNLPASLPRSTGYYPAACKKSFNFSLIENFFFNFFLIIYQANQILRKLSTFHTTLDQRPNLNLRIPQRHTAHISQVIV
jgi:hypothetical protein